MASHLQGRPGRTATLIETFHLDEAKRRIQHGRAGRPADRPGRRAAAGDRAAAAAARGDLALERLIDAEAPGEAGGRRTGSPSRTPTSTPRSLKEATIDEQRHAWVIEVAPETAIPACGEPTGGPEGGGQGQGRGRPGRPPGRQEVGGVVVRDRVHRRARRRAERRPGLAPGRRHVDTTRSTSDAIFTAARGHPTDVSRGQDGAYRIGRVTQIATSQVDGTFASRLDEAKVAQLADYRAPSRAT